MNGSMMKVMIRKPYRVMCGAAPDYDIGRTRYIKRANQRARQPRDNIGVLRR